MMNTNKSLNIPAVPAVLLAIISFQGGASLAKGLFPILGAETTTLIRVGLSAVILMAVNRPNLRKLTLEQWRAVIPYGVILGAMNLIFYLAIKRIPLGLGVTLEFLGPLMVAVFGSRRVKDLLWVSLAAAGIVLIAPWNTKSVDAIGVVLALLAGAFWAAYILLGSRTSRVMNDRDAVTVGMVFGTLVVLPFGIGSGGLSRLTPLMSLSGVGLALLSSAIPFTLEMSALRRIPARTFSILMSLEPAVAALCGLAFLHESLSFYEWIAVALVVVASSGAAFTAKKVSHEGAKGESLH
jgi:inner membrane transporter RhtA